MDLTLTPPETLGFDPGRLARIRPAMQTFVDKRGFGGMCTVVARRGRVVHFETAGWQDREAQLPLAPDTLYRIYSMTKPIVCTAFMTLLEEGRVQLYDFLAKYLPAFGKMKVLTKLPTGELQEADAVRPITVRDLLTHTAGLTYSFLEDSPVGALYRESAFMSDGQSTLEALIQKLARLPLAFQPGTRWHYSVGIDVIAHLIEVISGRPLQDYLRERIFEPLGMTDTAFYVPPEKRGRLAAMYGNPDIATHTTAQMLEAWTKGQSGRQEVAGTHPVDNDRTFARGGHGLYSTAADYLRFAQMLLNRGALDGRRILAPKTVDFMHSNHLPAALLPYELAGVPALGYGFGLGSRVLLNVAASGVLGSAGEYGWGGAAKTYYWVDPQEQLIGLLMTQYMVAFDLPDKVFQNLVYAALLD